MHFKHDNQRKTVKTGPCSTGTVAAPTPFGKRSVGFLTRFARRTVTLTITWRRLSLCIPLSLAAPLALATAEPRAWQPIDEITATAESFLAGHMRVDEERTELIANPLDPRLQLPLCSDALAASLQRGAKISNRMTVGVRCNGAKPWKIYVTVDVVVTDALLVAARSMPSGHVVTAADLETAHRDVSGLTSGYLSHPDQVVGRRLKHQLIEGRALTPAILKEDVVIHRGQSVTLTIDSESLNIKMEGKALMDGHVNQRIRVQNTLSKRVVEGIVRSPQHVEVLVF